MVSGGAGTIHLYVSLACPWAHRTLIFRALKRLKRNLALGRALVHGQAGWTFDEVPALFLIRFLGHRLYEVYLRSDPTYTGRVTVPVLGQAAT
jgi:putative glutathione S-transferase